MISLLFSIALVPILLTKRKAHLNLKKQALLKLKNYLKFPHLEVFRLFVQVLFFLQFNNVIRLCSYNEFSVFEISVLLVGVTFGACFSGL